MSRLLGSLAAVAALAAPDAPGPPGVAIAAADRGPPGVAIARADPGPPGVATAPADPGPPVVSSSADGSFGVAVPGLYGEPALAGDRVAFAVGDVGRDRLLGAGAAIAGGATTLYAAPASRPSRADSFDASGGAIALLRTPRREVQTCIAGGPCDPSAGQVIAGPPGRRLARRFGATERLPARGSCRRRIAQVEGGLSVSGARVAYVRRVRCMAPRRRGRLQVVVRNALGGRAHAVRRGGADAIELAGDFLAVEPSRRGADHVAVLDLRGGRVAYRAPAGDASWVSLGDDGTLVVARFGGCCEPVATLDWYSLASPRAHRLPQRVAASTGAPMRYARGRIAYVERYDDAGATLAVADLAGAGGAVARFDAPEVLDAFDFDGERILYAYTRYRPDAGRADAGLHAICTGDRLMVQASATVVEVHPVAAPARMTAPPSAAPYRSPRPGRPECPYRDR